MTAPLNNRSPSWTSHLAGLYEAYRAQGEAAFVRIDPDDPPPRMDLHESKAFLAGARLAKKLFPGEIGDALAEVLLATHEFSYRVGMEARSRRLLAALHDEQRKRAQGEQRRWAQGGPGVA